MAPVGRHFRLVSRINGFVLGLGSAAHGAGPSAIDAPVITCEKNELEDDVQVWFEDKVTGTIQLRVNGLCLHIGDDNILRVRPVETGNSGQQWSFKDGLIQNANDPDRVLDISGSKTEPGASVCSWSVHGGSNQLWDQEFVNPKFFYLKSELSGKVLDIEGQCPDPGTKLCVWDQKPEESASNQLWSIDRQGILRSRMNDFAIDYSDSQELTMQLFDSGRAGFQSWVIQGSQVALKSKPDKVFDIADENMDSGARVCVWDAHGGANQKWTIEYV